MLAFVSRPPDPRYAGEGRRDMWLTRLEEVEPFIHVWLDHQARDRCWRHSSVCEDYGAIDAAVLAVGGRHDPYTLRAYVSDSHPPATVYDTLPGRWVGEPAWPSPTHRPSRTVFRAPPAPLAPRRPRPGSLPAAHRRGRAVGVLRVRNGRGDLGVGAAEGTAEADRRGAARLGPSGSATPPRTAPPFLATRGVLNLSARQGRDGPRAVGAGSHAGREVRAERHRSRLPENGRTPHPARALLRVLAVDPAAAESAAGYTLDPAGSVLELPVRARESESSISFEEPEQSEPLRVSFPATLDQPRPERLVVRDVAKVEWRLKVDPRYGGTACIPTDWSSPRTRGRVKDHRDGPPVGAGPLGLAGPAAPAGARPGDHGPHPLGARL